MKNLKEYFCKFLEYNKETGDLFWKHREPINTANKIFNALYSGKKAGSICNSPKSKTSYWSIKIGNKSYKSHRVIFAMVEGYMPEQVDHIDHNGLNNKWSNLRASNSSDNSKNLPMQKSNKTGCIGVNWHKSAKKWQARAVDKSGKRIDLGRFDDINDAIKARKDHEIKFGYYEHRGNI